MYRMTKLNTIPRLNLKYFTNTSSTEHIQSRQEVVLKLQQNYLLSIVKRHIKMHRYSEQGEASPRKPPRGKYTRENVSFRSGK